MNTFDIQQVMRDLEFDKSDLDSAWSEHAKLVMQYGHKLAEAEKSAATAKRKFDILEAQLYREARSSLSFDGVRVNESMIESEVKRNPSYNTSRSLYEALRAEADNYKAAVVSFSHRRDMLVQASKSAIIEMEKLGDGRFSAPLK